MPKSEVAIYFGSQTGTAEGFANELKNEAQKNGLKATVIDLSEVTEISFTNYRYMIFCMATHYEGDPTDNSTDFWSWFSKEEEIPQGWLAGFKFAVFGLGDASYVNFAKMGRETDRLLEKYGAQRAYKLGIGSDEEGNIGAYFKEWKKDLWTSLSNEFVMTQSEGNMDEEIAPMRFQFSTIISSFATEKSIAEQAKNCSDLSFKAQSYLKNQTLQIVSISELRQNPSQTNFCKLVELKGWKGGYETGGNLQLYPKNTKSKIERMMNLLNFTVNYIFTTKQNSHKKCPVPSPLSVNTFLSDYIDLNGQVSKSDMLKLRDLLSPEDYFQ